MQSRLDKTLGKRDNSMAASTCRASRADSVNLFSFVDTTDTLGINTNIHWSHRLNRHVFLYAGYHFSRLRTEVTPNLRIAEYFRRGQHCRQRSGSAYWGPPGLNFLLRICRTERREQLLQSQPHRHFLGFDAIYHGKHNITVGGEFRKQEYNDYFQQNPRGASRLMARATRIGSGSISSSASPTPARSLSATQTSIFASRFTRSPSTMTGASCRSSPSMRECGGTTVRR